MGVGVGHHATARRAHVVRERRSARGFDLSSADSAPHVLLHFQHHRAVRHAVRADVVDVLAADHVRRKSHARIVRLPGVQHVYGPHRRGGSRYVRVGSAHRYLYNRARAFVVCVIHR